MIIIVFLCLFQGIKETGLTQNDHRLKETKKQFAEVQRKLGAGEDSSAVFKVDRETFKELVMLQQN